MTAKHYPIWHPMAKLSSDMTLRDYFASKALQGMLADSKIGGTPAKFAIMAYALADAMLKAREA